jgi:hypothetical protein
MRRIAGLLARPLVVPLLALLWCAPVVAQVPDAPLFRQLGV